MNGVEKNKEVDVGVMLAEELKKPYYDVLYLNNFSLGVEKLDMSIIIATYNRCPYKPGTLRDAHNPLVWALETALAQKIPVKEIIIVDDASNDYTAEVVKEY